jgi:uncharacterized protein YndB with AHSA1/START domain
LNGPHGETNGFDLPTGYKKLAVGFVGMVMLAGCGVSAANRDRLAAQGSIQEDAPVKAVAEIVIAAPPNKIMGLLTNIRDWPQWQPDISKATVHGSTVVGTEFVWSTGGMDIHSTIQLVDPERSICWTGRMLHIHAIHCWTLTVLSDDTVQVKTRESMDGWLISRIYSSPELLQSDQRWLAKLKQAAER